MESNSRTNSTIANGALFSITFQHSRSVDAAFVKHLTTPFSQLPPLISFNWVSGRETNISKLPLLYDIAPLNMNSDWRLANKDRISEPDTIILRKIKDELLYRTTYDLNVPVLENLTVALEMTLGNHTLVSCFKSHPNVLTGDDTVNSEAIEPRLFSGDSIDNNSARRRLISDYLSSFTRSGPGNSLKPQEDPHRNYCQVRLPLSYDEIQLYNVKMNVYESMVISYAEARLMMRSIRLLDHSAIYICRLDDILNDVPPAALRISKPHCVRFMRRIYCLTRMFANHADDGITRGLRIQMFGDDPDMTYSMVCDSFGVSTTMTSPLTSSLRYLDPSVLCDISVAMCKVYTNPNLYSITLSDLPIELGHTLPDLYGILTFQALFCSTVVSRETKMCLNNYIARFIVENVTLNSDIKTVLDVGIYSLTSWFNDSDKLRILYSYFGVLPPILQSFLNIYFGVSTSPHLADLVLVGDNALDMPYADHRLMGDLVHINLWNGNVNDIFNRPLINPISPYSYGEMTNWTGAHLSATMTALTEVIANSNSLLKSVCRRYKGAMSNGTARLKGLFNPLIERVYLVASSPYSDDVYYTDNDLPKKPLMLSLKMMNSCLVYPSLMLDSYPRIQDPMEDQDDMIQTIMPLLAYMVQRIRAGLGRYSRGITLKKMFRIAVDMIGSKVNVGMSLLQNLVKDSNSLDALLRMLTNHDLDQHNVSLINIMDANFAWLTDMQFKRGYRTHFYLTKQPAFLNCDMESVTNGFYTNAVISPSMLNFVDGDLDSQSLNHLISQRNTIYLRGHDVRGSRTGIEELMSKLDNISDPFDHAINMSPVSAIRVNHPCIIRVHLQELNGQSFMKPKSTIFIPSDEIVRKLDSGVPIEIDVTIQLMNADFLRISSTKYNGCYSERNMVMTADLFPMPLDFIDVNDYMNSHNNPLSMRKEPLVTESPSYGLSFSGSYA